LINRFNTSNIIGTTFFIFLDQKPQDNNDSRSNALNTTNKKKAILPIMIQDLLVSNVSDVIATGSEGTNHCETLVVEKNEEAE